MFCCDFLSSVLYACKLRRLYRTLCTAVAMPRYKPLGMGDKRVLWMPYTLYCYAFNIPSWSPWSS